MKVVIEITVERDDGDHHGLLNIELPPIKDEAEAVMAGAVVGADVAVGVVTLLTHTCSEEELAGTRDHLN